MVSYLIFILILGKLPNVSSPVFSANPVWHAQSYNDISPTEARTGDQTVHTCTNLVSNCSKEIQQTNMF